MPSILQPLSVRLAQRLLAEREMAMREGAAQQPELRLSQEGLAQRLGASRQSVNRQLKEWESQGLLRLVYGGVTAAGPGGFAACLLEPQWLLCYGSGGRVPQPFSA